jgi:hypothetical protein
MHIDRITKYWVVVVSKDHIERGISGGFIQANHGKSGSLKRMAVNDWVMCYSPTQKLGEKEPCRAFTEMGKVADEGIYQYKMSENFVPFRRNIEYLDCKNAPIVNLINDLDFIKNKNSWGYPFRFGFFEISEHEFNIIKLAMLP